MGVLRLAAALLLAAAPAQAQAQAKGTLMGRDVSIHIETFDQPSAPVFLGQRHRARVGEGIEFGLRREGAQNDVDVVPILVDILADRIEISYETAPPGELLRAAFNGYVLEFSGACAVLKGARIDADATRWPLGNDRLAIDGNRLYVNVAALSHDRKSRLAMDLEVGTCDAGGANSGKSSQ